MFDLLKILGFKLYFGFADNVAITAGSGTTVAADEVVDGTLGTVKVQYVKIMDGTLDGTSKATVNATGLKVDASGAAVPVTDNSGSLTVDNSVLSVVGGGTEATAQRVTIASDSTGVLSVDDNGGSLTVDGTVATTNAGTFVVQENGSALTALQLIDDTVATLGTTTYTEATTKGNVIGAVRRDADTTLVDTTNEIGPLQMDANGRLKVEAFSGETLPVSLTSTTITGTVAVTQSGTWDEVGINDSGNSITVDNATLSVTGGGVEASALRVTIANDSTGVVSVDDNGGSITVDGTVSITSNSSVNVSQMNGVTVSMDAGATGTGTQRVVQANGTGRTLLSSGGSASSSGNNTLVAAGTNRLKVFAFSLTTLSTTAVTCIFQSGAGGTELWRCVLQAPTGVNSGANLSVTPPAWLFATASATLLNLNLSSASTVHWSVAYYDEA